MRILAGVVLAVVGLAQQPAFDVASVKQVKDFQTGTASEKVVVHPGSLMMQPVRLRRIIMWAYSVKDFQISGPSWLGAPGWGGGDLARFEVQAKAPAETAIPEMRLMLQRLLAERFRLVLHREEKEVPAFVLTAGKQPMTLKRSADQEADVRPVVSANGFSVLNATMDDLAQILSGPMRLPVLDRTGLTGRYDVVFGSRGSPDRDEQLAIMTDDLRSMGLELKRGKEKLEFLAVDSAEQKPIQN